MLLQQQPPSMLHCLTLNVYMPQEMEKLKEELENMNDLMEQKDTLTQKLEVRIKLCQGNHALFQRFNVFFVDLLTLS